ncbi:cytochrome b5 isoform X1 [Oryza glaberrima]|uniref:Cytochrome b5 heme-binding domain-containing protein n=1 Tax=Oryza barthii TaxID=65489 RepID=A0A0D3FP80_9ORYZ|nr:cytochrome b5 isoform X1 [Oryza glaberrima]
MGFRLGLRRGLLGRRVSPEVQNPNAVAVAVLLPRQAAVDPSRSLVILGRRRLEATEQREREEEMPTLTKLYSLEEAARHNTADDCWVVVDGKIYDVTKYLDDHPGGADVLLEVTGKDAKEEFDDAGHSESAKELMQDYFIGELDPTPNIPEMEVFRKEQDVNFASKLMANAAQYWPIPATVVGISVVIAVLYARQK